MYLGQVKIEKSRSCYKTCSSLSPYANLEGAVYGVYKKDGTLMEKLTISQEL